MYSVFCITWNLQSELRFVTIDSVKFLARKNSFYEELQPRLVTVFHLISAFPLAHDEDVAERKPGQIKS